MVEVIFSTQRGGGLGPTEPPRPPAGPGTKSGIRTWFRAPDGVCAWAWKREEELKEVSHLRELFGLKKKKMETDANSSFG